MLLLQSVPSNTPAYGRYFIRDRHFEAERRGAGNIAHFRQLARDFCRYRAVTAGEPRFPANAATVRWLYVDAAPWPEVRSEAKSISQP